LVATPFLGGVIDLTGPHIVIVRPGLRALGLTLFGLIIPCGPVPSSGHPYLRVCELLRRFSLLWWRRFESSGGVISSLRVKGEKPSWPRLERFCSLAFRNLLGRGRVMLIVSPYRVGAPRGMTPSKPGNHGHRSPPGRSPSHLLLSSLPSLVGKNIP
jgi:hypothetical protein